MRMIVTSTALNAGHFAARCVASVRFQSFTHWRYFYIDADSDDDTFQFASHARADDARIQVQRNRPRKSLLDNLLPIWRNVDDEDIIVWIDGDDWLATEHALAVVAATYQKTDAWMTYGQFMWPDGTIGFAAPVGPEPRSEPWRATHLKTFKGWLLKEIRDEDLQQPHGAWYDLAIDQAIMLPMLEMAGDRAVFIPQILYVYNAAHSFEANGSPAERTRERELLRRIRSQPAYAPRQRS